MGQRTVSVARAEAIASLVDDIRLIYILLMIWIELLQQEDRSSPVQGGVECHSNGQKLKLLA